MIGEVLREVRINKKLTLKETSAGVMAVSNLSKIENEGKGETMSVQSFFQLLDKLNISVVEFCKLIDDPLFNQRVRFSEEIPESLRSKDYHHVSKLIRELNKLYEDTGVNYFQHQLGVLRASKVFHETRDIKKAMIEITPIKDYLNQLDQWYYYELELFNNSFHFYEIDAAIKLGEQARASVERRYDLFKNNELVRAILVNLAIKCLEHNRFLKAYSFASDAMGMTQSTKFLYENTIARLIHQIASYKLKNGQFDEDYLKNLIQYYKFMKMDEVFETLNNYVLRYGFELDFF